MYTSSSLDILHKSSQDSSFSENSISIECTQPLPYIPSTQALDSSVGNVSSDKENSTGFWGAIKSLVKRRRQNRTYAASNRNTTNNRRVPGFLSSDPMLYGGFVVAMDSAEDAMSRSDNSCPQLDKTAHLNANELNTYPILPLINTTELKEKHIPGTTLELENEASQHELEEASKPKLIDCSFCMEKIKPTDSVRVIPCFHFFHATCLDPWLLQFGNHCPTCRFNLSKYKE
ncbi:hypothetical protein BB560_004684 [Smittium megazygosporum]|uniref:RING-type domain-containing protein n=1 Tax=Smittium megazygosporum TaxID=133381 RepID=A0A2T9Z8J1_9FUNG|nr:hypothetical protein BB560_004684 [Smittium megazygosporum]